VAITVRTSSLRSATRRRIEELMIELGDPRHEHTQAYIRGEFS
jgi:hypothetical protein